VFGTGSWGTAFAAVLADAGTDVRMWGRRSEVVDAINAGCNDEYLPELPLPDRISATSDPEEAASGADIVVLAVPSQTLRANLSVWGSVLPADAAVVSLMKGVELGTTKRMSEVIADAADIDTRRIVVVSGPNLAREIAVKQPAASVVAASDERMAQRVADACAAAYFRPYTHSDVVGTEIAGATKNVIALAVGMAEGLGMGDNSKASIITRGLAETTRLGGAPSITATHAKAIFQTPVEGFGQTPTDDKGARLVYRVTAENDRPYDPTKQEDGGQIEKISQSMGNDVVSALVKQLRSDLGAKIHPDKVAQVTGSAN
jgi:glycerol-3-phosphate dehydrogenase (NAD(P)+)